jgi:hypothetical protein
VTDLAALASMAALEELSLAGTAADDLTPLHWLGRLQRVDLEDTSVPAAQIASLQSALPGLEIMGRRTGK